ncbi:MAG: hypothetical protein M0R47_19390 [Methylobacter sp.]|jgi:hypothetical protein|uniref:hypothetical protein n=1 Tax=Methylobacter sp. TaxID=2051955 RepID=UPI0025CBCC5A|nr:hypothetical protein [Methylobacter sp.]MCK9622685.1 hypothetical protein [Methylobacter sp.]
MNNSSQREQFYLGRRRNELKEILVTDLNMGMHVGYLSLFIVIFFAISLCVTWLIFKYRHANLDASKEAQAHIAEHLVCNGIIPFFGIYFILAFCAALIWAIHLYINLRARAKLEEINFAIGDLKYSEGSKKKQSDPFSFHSLAESHKEWAQVWFTSSLVIFIGGVVYATFNIGIHICPTEQLGEIKNNTNLVVSILEIINYIIPNVFVYSIFIFIWLWASKHQKAHWHNFVVNAYRHRALCRLKEFRNDVKDDVIDKLTENDSQVTRDLAWKTILDMYRESGLLLITPRDSAYLDTGQSEDIPRKLAELEDVMKSFTSHKD